MRIITEPTVSVVARTVFLGDPDFPIPADGTDAEKLGAFSAKVCYDSHGENGRANRDNQRRVIQERHGSVLEHPHASVYVRGITRGVSLEINRHRHFGISQRSTRYVAEEDGAIVLVPFYAELWRKHEDKLGWGSGDEAETLINYSDDPEAELVAHHVNHSVASNEAYREEVEMLMSLNPLGLEGFSLRKWARGNARNLLSHNTETRAVYTINFRAFRHYLESRSSEHAEDEIRVIANKMLEVLSPLAPVYFEDYMPRKVRGILEWTTPNTKV